MLGTIEVEHVNMGRVRGTDDSRISGFGRVVRSSHVSMHFYGTGCVDVWSQCLYLSLAIVSCITTVINILATSRISLLSSQNYEIDVHFFSYIHIRHGGIANMDRQRNGKSDDWRNG